MNHDVEVVGWGETPAGIKYWVARNSWGTYWGEEGFFKIVRGINNMAIETECFFAVVDASGKWMWPFALPLSVLSLSAFALPLFILSSTACAFLSVLLCSWCVYGRSFV